MLQICRLYVLKMFSYRQHKLDVLYIFVHIR